MNLLKYAMFVVLGVVTAGSARAATELGQFNDWTAFTDNAGGQKSCFVVSKPTKKAPSNVRRDEVLFYVTYWANNPRQAEPNVVTGYPYKPGSNPTISIGDATFSMFAKGDAAWMADAASENKLVAAMRKGSTMIVKGTSRRGTLTTDNYSLTGVTKALARAAKACQ